MTQFKSAALGLALILGGISVAQGASAQMMHMSMHDKKMMSSCMAMSSDAMMSDMGCMKMMKKMNMSDSDMKMMMSCKGMSKSDMMANADCMSMKKMHPAMMNAAMGAM